MTMRNWLAISMLLAGCPPTLHGDDDDNVADDDDATGDDDDATGDDDDATGDDDDIWPDDDDATEPELCFDWGGSTVWFEGPEPDPTTGPGWIDGELLWTGDALEVSWGAAIVARITSSAPDPLSWVSGFGRVYYVPQGFENLASGAFLAVEAFDGWTRIVQGNVAEIPEPIATEFGLTIRPDPTACQGNQQGDECGSFVTTPVLVSATSPDGGWMEEAELWPNQWYWGGLIQGTVLNGRQYLEMDCDDVPDTQVSFSLVIQPGFIEG